MQGFNDTLADALRCYLGPYFDNEDELFIDTEQCGGGDDLDLKSARAKSESVCMVLIYTPKYEAHAYTRREYEAMRQQTIAQQNISERVALKADDPKKKVE